MSMRLLYIGLLIILCLMLIVSCDKNTQVTENNIAPETSKIVDSVLTEEQLLELIDRKDSMDDAMNRYPTEYVSKFDLNYRVAYYGESSVAIIIYDTDGLFVMGKVHKMKNSKSDFDSIQIGQTLDEVMTFDPEAEYLFLYTGSNSPRVSTHYTKDKYVINITYDENNFISRIEVNSLKNNIG